MPIGVSFVLKGKRVSKDHAIRVIYDVIMECKFNLRLRIRCISPTLRLPSLTGGTEVPPESRAAEEELSLTLTAATSVVGRVFLASPELESLVGAAVINGGGLRLFFGDTPSETLGKAESFVLSSTRENLSSVTTAFLPSERVGT